MACAWRNHVPAGAFKSREILRIPAGHFGRPNLLLRDYTEIVEAWVQGFVNSMDDSVKGGYAEPGDGSGACPAGIKIIFDGYGYNEETDENDDASRLSFAVFVHQNSLTQPFPPHEIGFGLGIAHRPAEECYMNVWYDVASETMEIAYFEENDGTEMDHEQVVEIMFQIQARDSG